MLRTWDQRPRLPPPDVPSLRKDRPDVVLPVALPPERSFVGEAAATADLGSPTDALVVVDTSRPDHDEVTVVDEGGDIRLTTAPAEHVEAYGPGAGSIRVLDGPGGTFVRLDNATRDRAVASFWSLDDPCTALDGSAETVAS